MRLFERIQQLLAARQLNAELTQDATVLLLELRGRIRSDTIATEELLAGIDRAVDLLNVSQGLAPFSAPPADGPEHS